MAVKQLLAMCILALGANAIPQASSSSDSARSTVTSAASLSSITNTGVSPAQTTAFESALSLYLVSLEGSPQFSSLGVDIFFADSNAANQLQASPSELLPITPSSVDLRSLATNPPLSFSSLSVYSDLGTSLIDRIQAMQTSVVLDIASIDRNILGISTTISTPSPTSSSTSQGAAAQAIARPTGLAALGAAVGALGAAVVLL